MIEVRAKKDITINAGRIFTFEKEKSYIRYDPLNMKCFELFHDDGYRVVMVPIDMGRMKIKIDLLSIIKMIS